MSLFFLVSFFFFSFLRLSSALNSLLSVRWAVILPSSSSRPKRAETGNNSSASVIGYCIERALSYLSFFLFLSQFGCQVFPFYRPQPDQSKSIWLLQFSPFLSAIAVSYQGRPAHVARSRRTGR
ncbi:hypothetical protein V8F06_001053 [Rhypophila decipiens]